jgi:hypothetical protein
MPTSPRASQRIILALAGAGLAFGLVVAWLTLESDHVEDRGFEAALRLLVGWSFIGTGLYAWWRRPGNRTGLLMAAVGFAWFATSVGASDNDLVFTIGIALDGIFAAVLGHLLIAFPTGRLATRAERLLVAGIYLSVTVLQLPALLFEDTDEPRNLLMVESNQDLSDLLDALQFAVAFALIVATFVIVARRRAQVAPAQRPVLAPVLWTGDATLAALTVALTFDAVSSPKEGLERLSLALFATVPFGFLVGGLRTRLGTRRGAAVGAYRRCRGRARAREPTAVGGAARPDRGPARLARPHRRGRRRRATASRARPPRRRPVTPRRARHEAPHGAPPRGGPAGRRGDPG